MRRVLAVSAAATLAVIGAFAVPASATGSMTGGIDAADAESFFADDIARSRAFMTEYGVSADVQD